MGFYYNPSSNLLSGETYFCPILVFITSMVSNYHNCAELNVLDNITATTTELNYTDGVTSNIQTQLDAKGTLTNQNGSGNSEWCKCDATTLGTFTGSTISDNKDIKVICSKNSKP